jgi:hypothetical protein
MRRRLVPGIISILASSGVGAQVNAPVNGPYDKARPVEAFVHATIHASPGEVLKDATLLIQGDRVIALGVEVEVPPGSVMHDCKGLHLWPALIEPYSELGAEAAKEEPAERGAHYWNRAIRASRSAARLFVTDEEKAAALRGQGFGTVITHRMDGIARGTGGCTGACGLSAFLLPQGVIAGQLPLVPDGLDRPAAAGIV